MPELMKGNVWKDRKDAKDRKGFPIVRYPIYAEIKYDEIRCHVKLGCDPTEGTVQFLSYAGKPLANMQEFAHLFRDLAARTGYSEFDCGFEVNGNFNDSYRWVRSTRGLPPDLKSRAEIQFYLYDLPTNQEEYHKRKIQREWVARQVQWLKCPSPVLLDNEEAVDAYYNQVIEQGHEGLMLKSLSHTYERRRTDGWLKMKPEETADGRIVGVVEAVATVDDPSRGVRIGDGLRRCNSVHLVLEDGSTATPHGIPHEQGRDMFQHPEKYIGEWVEFAYMEKDRQGGYRHPTFRRLREAKQ